MKSFVTLFLFLASTMLSFGQQFEPAVLATSGGSGQAGKLQIDWTLGETAVEGITGQTSSFTEGFHQPWLIAEQVYTATTDDANPAIAPPRFNVYPNPVLRELNVQLPDNEEAYRIHIHDAQGGLIQVVRPDIHDRKVMMTLDDLAPGLFYVHITDDLRQPVSIFKITKIQ